jgi:hypothetical protein
VTVPPDWAGLRVWRGQVSSQFDKELGRFLHGGETQVVIDFSHPHNAVLERYVKTLTAQPTQWKQIMFRPNDRVTVRAMAADETAPKTVPQGSAPALRPPRATPRRTTPPNHDKEIRNATFYLSGGQERGARARPCVFPAEEVHERHVAAAGH